MILKHLVTKLSHLYLILPMHYSEPIYAHLHNLIPNLHLHLITHGQDFRVTHESQEKKTILVSCYPPMLQRCTSYCISLRRTDRTDVGATIFEIAVAP